MTAMLPQHRRHHAHTDGPNRPWAPRRARRGAGAAASSRNALLLGRYQREGAAKCGCGGMRSSVPNAATYPGTGALVETAMLLQSGSAETLIAMAWRAEASLQQGFGLSLGLMVIDTIAACAGYARAGDEHDPAAGQVVLNTLKPRRQGLR